MNVEQLRKQAKELVRAARASEADAVARFGDLPVQLASAQLILAREHGYPSWPALVRVEVEQPFHTDLEYYEGRAEGIATVNDVPVAEARRDLAGRHGFPSWPALRKHVQALASGEQPPPPFVLAYRANEARDARGSPSSSTRTLRSSKCAARTATTCSGWRTASRSRGCCSSAGRT